MVRRGLRPDDRGQSQGRLAVHEARDLADAVPGRRRIVNTGSIAGLIGLPTSSAYVAAKHGVLGLTKTAAMEYAEDNIRVNAVCPGYIETKMTEDTMRRRGARCMAMVPFRRMGKPEEIAEMVLFLCSDRAPISAAPVTTSTADTWRLTRRGAAVLRGRRSRVAVNGGNADGRQPTLDQPPAGSTWGDFGADDERGRLNLLTPEKVLQGIAEVKVGKTFCLSLPLDYPGGAILSPRRHPPVLKPTMRGDRPNMNYPLRCDDPTATDIVCDDQVILTLQYSTQWDSLAHVGQMFDADGDGSAEDVFYNGYRAGRDIIGPAYYDAQGNMTPCDEPQGARHLGVQNMAESCMQGRGVMIDLEAHFGRTGHIVSYDELMEVMRKDNVVVEPGDFVLFRTGFAEMLLEMNKQPDREKLMAGTCRRSTAAIQSCSNGSPTAAPSR